MIRWACIALLAGCSHQPPVEIPIEVAVPCLKATIPVPSGTVTDAQLKHATTDRYPKLAGLRIEQDRAEKRVLRAAVDGCSALPARAASAAAP